MSWFLKLVICLSFIYFSEAKHQKKLPSAVVVGTVYCDTCFHQDLPKANHFITGASVEIQCKEAGSKGEFRQEVKTNNRGEFKFDLPISVSKHAKRIRGCSITLIRSNAASCAVAASTTSSSLRLKSTKDGTHVFSAGYFSFKPETCNQKSNTNRRLSPDSNSKKHTDQLPFVPTIPFLPPNPLLPPPSILPPNPFQPPPSVIPPIFPTPPPSIFPPILPTPSPPSPFLPLPPVPGLVPSPSPPPRPTFPIPLPPFPFQPTPGFPGVPPATSP